jgi:hypothetical protein
MKHYPEISPIIDREVNVYFFDKLDGSNIRAEWSPKRGFYKFGTRKHLLGEDDPMFGSAIKLIKDTEPMCGKVFRNERFESTVCYFEFLGENSFAGFHIQNEPHKVVLLDVDVYKQGFLTPTQFMKHFEGIVEIPKLLHYGQANEDIEHKIRNGTLPGMTFEGVVCKSSPPKKWALPIMFKIKSHAWLTKVKERHGNRADFADIV